MSDPRSISFCCENTSRFIPPGALHPAGALKAMKCHVKVHARPGPSLLIADVSLIYGFEMEPWRAMGSPMKASEMPKM